MDLLVLAALSISIGIILLAMGLSFLSQSLDVMDYNNNNYWSAPNSADYYQNPLYGINSKYFHYRPKGWVIVSKKQWKDIEKNIGIKIASAENVGYKQALSEIQAMIEEESDKAFPTSPYAVLDAEAVTPKAQIRDKYLALMDKYDPAKFGSLDKAFVQLAEIRQKQVIEAWQKIDRWESGTRGRI